MATKIKSGVIGTLDSNLVFADNSKAVFGAGSDLQIFHDASGGHSRIDDTGTGGLVIRGSQILLEKYGGGYMINAVQDGAVTIHYSGSEKLSTTSTGIDVTGVITSKADAALNDAQIGRINFTNTNSNASSNPIRASIFAGRQNSAWGGYLSLYTSTGTDAASEKVRITETGNVGIGTSSPSAPLHVGGEAYFDAGTRHYTYDDQANFWSLYTNTDDTFRFNYNGSGDDEIVINTSGNLGIGTNSPTSKISVVGGASDAGISIKSGGNAGVDPFRVTWTSGTEGDMFIVDDNGNVGIGTSSPESRLHISNKAAPANDVTLLTLQNGNGTGDIGTPDTFIDFVFKDTNTNVTPQARIAGHAGDGGDANTQILEGKGYLTFHTSDTTAESGVVAPPERMRITAAGEVVIGGTEVPSTVIDGTGAAGVLGIGNSSELYPAIALMSSQRNWLLYQNSLGNFQIYDSSSNDERFRLDTKGTMMTGASFAHNTYAHAAVFGRNSTPDGTVVIEDYDVSSGIGNTVLKCYLRDQDPATLANFIVFADGGGAVGSITHNDDGGGVSFNTTSDYRLKENVDYDWDATTLLKQLKPAKFNFISNSEKTVQGFLAHEVSDIVPSSVRGDKDHMMEIGTITDSNGDIVSEDVYEHFCKTDEGQAWTQTGTEPLYQQLDYARLVPLLTKAMQEQQTLIESLTARITELEG